jgi:hypothetical protein
LLAQCAMAVLMVLQEQSEIEQAARATHRDEKTN